MGLRGLNGLRNNSSCPDLTTFSTKWQMLNGLFSKRMVIHIAKVYCFVVYTLWNQWQNNLCLLLKGHKMLPRHHGMFKRTHIFTTTLKIRSIMQSCHFIAIVWCGCIIIIYITFILCPTDNNKWTIHRHVTNAGQCDHSSSSDYMLFFLPWKMFILFIC